MSGDLMTGKVKTKTRKPRRARKTPPGHGDVLRTLMDNLSDCHVFVKDCQSRFVTTNAFHLKSLGAKSLKDVVGRTDFDFFPKDLAQQYYDDEQRVIRTGRALIDRDERMLDPQGREHWFLTTKTPLAFAREPRVSRLQRFAQQCGQATRGGMAEATTP